MIVLDYLRNNFELPKMQDEAALQQFEMELEYWGLLKIDEMAEKLIDIFSNEPEKYRKQWKKHNKFDLVKVFNNKNIEVDLSLEIK